MTPDTLVAEPTSPREIADLFERYQVALQDARLASQSLDGRFVDAYSAGFLLAKIVVRASGYRVKGGDNHRDTLAAVPWLIGSSVQPLVDALEFARRKRNADLYDGVGMVHEGDLGALLHRIADLEEVVCDWLARKHPELKRR